MAFLFGRHKMDSTELSQCLNWLRQHYELTVFQDKEAELYNNALVKYGNSISTDSVASEQMVKSAKRLVQAATELVSRVNNIAPIPEAASPTHYAWQLVFYDYSAWATAQCAAIEAYAKGMQPRGEYVLGLLQQSEKSRKKAEGEEKKLLGRMKSAGLTLNDIQTLITNASKATANANWQPSKD